MFIFFIMFSIRLNFSYGDDTILLFVAYSSLSFQEFITYSLIEQIILLEDKCNQNRLKDMSKLKFSSFSCV